MKKVIILFIAVSSFVYGQKEKKLDSLFTSLYAAKEFNGNVLVAEKGKVIYEKSFGLANEKTQQKLDKNTVFELASVSKQFTAMGIVQLEKEGKLSYNDPLTKYFPELSFYKPITIDNLLHHTSGLPDYMSLFDKNWDKKKFATNKDVVEMLAKYKPELLFVPGDKYEYSNTGYALLGLIIEKVSKQSYGDYLNKKIFKPLGMANTRVYRSRYKPEKISNYALGYVVDSLGNKKLLDDLGKEYYTYYLDGIVGDGMVNSTTGDLLKWDRALYGDKLVNQKDKDLIFSSIVTKDNKDTRYGYGWAIDTKYPFGKIANHSGGWAGYITFIERDLDYDKTIIILQNNDSEAASSPVKQLRNILYDIKPIKVDLATLQKYAGKYTKKNSKTFEVFFENNKLYVPLNPQVKLELEAISTNKFKVRDFSPDVFYEFKILDDGSIKCNMSQPAHNMNEEGIKKI
ncbi:TPA: serine hydrolase domain-containing protein [Elizabethkingia anophelis]|uniref:serine hydrolase domain-containing protein n=1 Tax=Elizabethkingia anophelis TaxID=1117645 RepID=UPI0009994628|nr:serine hydrolase domain-containing protein [Elizabethkingia anophelis]MCT3815420.1 beta-lactamase family protein [Elizabethkingia anophelis]MCT3872667.1 beta-lactamase family protein [Elizabethkingia anophelis]MCT3921520.1 beta-lactamase family protein [Elizabethkingia anophelis]MCT3953861.1 beta-lactamase family protein [Elizabethkingia anophelis]MCT3957404.1 beta-lactamase family protein [Elizabethkingia anophelis]